jgi:hypothetical protein
MMARCIARQAAHPASLQTPMDIGAQRIFGASVLKFQDEGLSNTGSVWPSRSLLVAR